jgi:uncharacterized membrane protein YhiD involved in acid resistance
MGIIYVIAAASAILSTLIGIFILFSYVRRINREARYKFTYSKVFTVNNKTYLIFREDEEVNTIDVKAEIERTRAKARATYNQEPTIYHPNSKALETEYEVVMS